MPYVSAIVVLFLRESFPNVLTYLFLGWPPYFKSHFEAYPSGIIPSESKQIQTNLLRGLVSQPCGAWQWTQFDATYLRPEPKKPGSCGVFLGLVWSLVFWWLLIWHHASFVMEQIGWVFVLSWQILTNHPTLLAGTDQHHWSKYCRLSLLGFRAGSLNWQGIHWRFGSFQEIVLKGSNISGTVHGW